VNENYTVNLLEQAQAARAQANWSLLVEQLQQLLISPSLPEERLLDLAIEALVYGDFQERWDVAKLFPKLGKGVVEPLIVILEDEDAEEELRWFAGRILGEFSHSEAVRALVEVLKTAQSEELSGMAAAALSNIGSPAIAMLTELLAQEQTRLLAVRALSHIRCPATSARSASGSKSCSNRSPQ